MKSKISTFIIECLRTDVIDNLDTLLWEYGKFMKGVYEIIPNSNLIVLTVNSLTSGFQLNLNEIESHLANSGRVIKTLIL
jgi:hypothetical protein|nr:MAG TPA: hypothetical protein [Caudoviricetes sp.]